MIAPSSIYNLLPAKMCLTSVFRSVAPVRLRAVVGLGVFALLSATDGVAGVIIGFEPGPQLGPKQACVAATVNAGDSFNNIDGDRLVIHSLSGKFASSFSPCSGGDKPLLAEVEFIESPDFHAAFALDIPETFTPAARSDFERFELSRIRAYSSSRHMWLTAHSWDRRRVSDIDAFAAEQKRVQTLRGDITQTPTERVTIKGVPALRWQTEYKPRSLAPNLFSVTTVLGGDTEVAVVIIEGISRKVTALHAEMLRISEGSHGLAAEAQESTLTPSPMRQL